VSIFVYLAQIGRYYFVKNSLDKQRIISYYLV